MKKAKLAILALLMGAILASCGNSRKNASDCGEGVCHGTIAEEETSIPSRE